MRFRGIVLHTVGVAGDTTMAAIRRYHIEHNGWSDAGYHYGIRKDGTVEPGRSLTRAGAHCEGANDTIGICVYGDGDREPWTPEQWRATVELLADLCERHGWVSEQIHGHREAPVRLGAKPTTKTCPGRLVDPELVRSAVKLRQAAGVAP